MKIKYLFVAAIFAISIFVMKNLAHSEDNRTLKFGIVPQQASQDLARTWVPFLAYLSEKTGYQVTFNTAPTIPEFEKRLAEGQYDLAYMNPYHYVVFNKSHGYKAFCREKDTRLKGIIVVKKDSPIKDISELSGKNLAFPGPASFAATILTQVLLKNSGININPKYVNSHDSVYMTVAKGIYPAGGGVLRTFNNMDKSITDLLRILISTKDYTPHAFTSHPRVDDKTVSQIANVMISMSNNPNAASILNALNFKSFIPAKNEDWDDIRALNINPADYMEKN